MSLIPNKELELEGDWIIGELQEFDKRKFPNVYIMKKTINSQSGYYLYDMVKQKEIYKFPREQYPFHFHNTFNSMSNHMCYNRENQILTYITIFNNQNNDRKILFEKVKLSYKNYEFKTKTLNNLEIITTSNQIKNLNHTNYVMIYSSGFNKLIIFDFNTFEIIMEYVNKSYVYPNIHIHGIIFISGINELIIYDYINNKELETIINKTQNGSFILEQKGDYCIIKDGKSTSFYKFIKEDEIPDENKCVVCFSRTLRKSALVPCGHTQFCQKCIKSNFENCPLCREKIEKVIKLF